MSREVQQFLEMVRAARPGELHDAGCGKVTRVMYCEGCGKEAMHELVMHGDWEEWRCLECEVYGHWYRTG